MTSLLPQIDAHDFYLKLIGIGVAVGALIVYVLVSYFRSGRSFLVSGEAEEEDRIATKDTSIERLQRGTWNVNFLKATTYSSVCVSTVPLAAVFIFQQRLTSYDALFWSVVLIVAASETFSYFLSIQMWFMAHDAGGNPDIRLRYRRQATVSQNTGWMLLMLVVVLVLAAINTYAGWFAIAVGLFSTIYSFEYKARVSSWERWTEVTDLDLDHVRQLSNKVRWEMAKENEFQSGLSRDTIYVKNDGAELRPGDDSKPIKIFSWNIDRGHVPGIIADYIIEAKPDIVCLQEVDWKNRRTKRRDVLEEIARRTHMVGYYAVEFLEIDTPYRGKRLAGGGVCGNAILTKLKPETYYRVGLANEFDWKDWKSFTARRQKRVGERCAIAAEFAVGGKRLTVVSAHLENMRPSGVGGRDRQF